MAKLRYWLPEAAQNCSQPDGLQIPRMDFTASMQQNYKQIGWWENLKWNKKIMKTGKEGQG